MQWFLGEFLADGDVERKRFHVLQNCFLSPHTYTQIGMCIIYYLYDKIISCSHWKIVAWIQNVFLERSQPFYIRIQVFLKFCGLGAVLAFQD